jgi:hypothetical protein
VTDVSFDTNILIDCLNGVEAGRAELRRARRRWISRISWIEVMAGIDEAGARLVEDFLAQFSIDELTEDIGRLAAAMRRERGNLRLPDAIILASAQSRGRILVTRNTRDFPARMPGIRVPYTL